MCKYERVKKSEQEKERVGERESEREKVSKRKKVWVIENKSDNGCVCV